MNANLYHKFVSFMAAATLIATTAIPALAQDDLPGADATISIMVSDDGKKILMVADRPELYVQGDEVSNQTLTGVDLGDGKWSYELPYTAKSFEVKYAAKWVMVNGFCKLTAGTTWVQCTDAATYGDDTAATMSPLATQIVATQIAAGTPMPTTAPTSAAQSPAEPAGYNLNPDGQWQDGAMWHVIPAEKLMVWTGGTSWTHVNFNEDAKKLLKAGYTARFTMSVPFETRACRSDWTGTDSDGNIMNPYTPSNCQVNHFRAGTYEVTGWAYDLYCKDQVGFRAIPVDAAPWDETPTCDRCVWPFPQGTSEPSYMQPKPIEIVVSGNVDNGTTNVVPPTEAAPTAAPTSAPTAAPTSAPTEAGNSTTMSLTVPNEVGIPTWVILLLVGAIIVILFAPRSTRIGVVPAPVAAPVAAAPEPAREVIRERIVERPTNKPVAPEHDAPDQTS